MKTGTFLVYLLFLSLVIWLNIITVSHVIGRKNSKELVVIAEEPLIAPEQLEVTIEPEDINDLSIDPNTTITFNEVEGFRVDIDANTEPCTAGKIALSWLELNLMDVNNITFVYPLSMKARYEEIVNK